MLDRVFEASYKNLIFLHPEDGIEKAKNYVYQNGHYYFPVIENEIVIGVVTLKDLLSSHPNRIVADAMSTKYSLISYDDYLWSAKEMFANEKIEVLIVQENTTIIGMLTKTQVEIKLEKFIDPLTGLYRNNYIYYCANKLIKHNQLLSFIFIDINRFGLIDKKYGHTVGDNILKEISQQIVDTIPEDTYLCRYAGDEFLILTPYLIEESIYLAEKLNIIISSHTFSNSINVTIAAGVSGGQRITDNSQCINTTIKKLINHASLASSKAKLKKCNCLSWDKLVPIET